MGFLVALWLMFSPSEKATADEVTNQVVPLDQSITDTSTATVQINIQLVQDKVISAETALSVSSESESTKIIESIISNNPGVDAKAASEIAITQEPISTAVADASTKISEANTAIQSAQNALSVATTANQAVESQITVVAEAITNLNNAQTVLETVTQQVQEATIVIVENTTSLQQATAAVQEQTIVVQAETSELDTLKNTPSDTKTFTTSGYVAPITPETPTVTTTTLPAMWDAATKIQTPFDIKLGNTLYEGQGSSSQIYVTSKATITFGVGDFNYWDFPAGPHISVYGSDFMSAGPNAGITVTTTETTLAIDWDLHRFGDNNGPITNVNWVMTVNPDTGEWTGIGSVAGNTTALYNGPRIGVRDASGQPIQEMTNVSDESLSVQIEQQTVIVNQETETLNTLIAEKSTAENTLLESNQVLSTLTAEKTNAEIVVADKTQIKTNEVTLLNQLTETATITTQSANTLADVAVVKVNDAVASMQNATQVTQDYYAEQQRLAAEAEAARIAAEAEAARIAAEAEAARIAAEAEAALAKAAAEKAEADAALAAQQKADAEARAAEQARLAAEAEALRIARDAEIAAQQAANEKAAAEAKAAEEARIAVEQAAKEAEAARIKAEEDARIQAEKDAQAKADAEKAEAEAKAKAEQDRLLEEQKAKDEADRLAQEEANAKAQAEKEAQAAKDKAAEEAKIEAEQKAKEAEAAGKKAEQDKKIAEEKAAAKALEDAKKLAESGKELTQEQKSVVAEVLIEKAISSGQAITAAQIQSSGIEYKDLPAATPVETRQDENGNAVVITAEVAAQVELLQDPGALLDAALSDPGAALQALGSVGADMSDEEREEATEMVVATVVAAGAAINAAAVATGGATGGGTGGGSSGGGSGANSPGSRGGRRW